MKTKFAAVAAGVVMLGSAAIADAADVATPNSTQFMTLTDAQMEKVTAGHLWRASKGWRKLHGGFYFDAKEKRRFGPHKCFGAAGCP